MLEDEIVGDVKQVLAVLDGLPQQRGAVAGQLDHEGGALGAHQPGRPVAGDLVHQLTARRLTREPERDGSPVERHGDEVERSA